MARLLIRDGESERPFELTGTLVAGRAPECGLVMDVQEASRRQFQIERTELGWKVVDLESRNGTRVNGKVSNQHLLKPGDIIKVGRITLKFEDAPAVDSSAAVPAPAQPPDPKSLPLPERRTRRAHAPRRAAPGLAGLAAGVMGVAVVGIVALIAFRNLTGDSAARHAGKADYERAMSIVGRDPAAAIRILRSIPPAASEWFDLAQKQVRSMSGGAPEGESEEAAWDRLRDLARARTKPGEADEVIRECLSFLSRFPDSERNAEIDAILAGARERQAAARAQALESATREIDSLLESGRFGEAVRRLSDLHEQHRHDFGLRRTFEGRLREAVDAGRRHFDKQYREAGALASSEPERARRLYAGLLDALGDGAVPEFSPLCLLATMQYERLSP